MAKQFYQISFLKYKKKIIILATFTLIYLSIFYPIGSKVGVETTVKQNDDVVTKTGIMKRFVEQNENVVTKPGIIKPSDTDVIPEIRKRGDNLIRKRNPVKGQRNVKTTRIEHTRVEHTRVEHTRIEHKSKWNPKEYSELYRIHKNNITRFFAPVNATSVQFINNELVECKDNGNKIKLLMGIKSTAGNIIERENIRKTWGAKATKMGVDFRFIIGNTNDEYTKQRIKLEKEHFMDIIEADFKDNYFNLTLKSLLFYKWTIQYCPFVKHIAELDDDVIVNIPNLIKNLNRVGPMNAAGYQWKNTTPFRIITHKWYVPKYIYPWAHYPTFLSGPFTVLGINGVKAIYNASLDIPYFHMEDVYEFGMLAQVGGVVLLDWRSIVNFYYRKQNICKTIAYIEIPPSKYLEEWENLKKKSATCKNI